MLDHVSIGVRELERSRCFYDAALRPLGIVRTLTSNIVDPITALWPDN
jgi:catechol 2,3-dioxygenase-like lactoylglutathione lyase family enzyme